MSETGILLLCVFGFLLVTGVPIAVTLALSVFVGLMWADLPSVVLAQRTISGTQIFSLLAIPGFILTGDLMARGGLSPRLIKIGQTLVGHVTGGLGMVTVISATFFAAISGSAPATTAAVGKIMIPEMERRGYGRPFPTALAVASGPIGQMIPPSIPMVIWGVVSEQSISKLFLAGVIPGLMITLVFMAACWFAAHRLGVKTEDRRATGMEFLRALWDGKWALAAPVIILGGIYGGIFTPTEASAVGVFYGLIVGLFVHRELRVADLYEIILGAMKTTAIICLIIATAAAFGWLVAFERIPAQLAEGVLSISSNPIVTLLMLNVCLLIIGAVMDNIAAMIILGTVLTSIGSQLGMDPIHLGAVVVINFAIGMATPPFGYSLFVGTAISNLTIERIALAIWPLLLLQLAVLLAITFIPSLTLFLPSLLG
ncbi:TRAP transporter large permease [Hwanghaeella sp.]|uniref:TRAP transporter large permease n=1 Tax=Hwanghaeella sp. TaxID=2605943 RepID=UPI003CCC0A05